MNMIIEHEGHHRNILICPIQGKWHHLPGRLKEEFSGLVPHLWISRYFCLKMKATGNGDSVFVDEKDWKDFYWNEAVDTFTFIMYKVVIAQNDYNMDFSLAEPADALSFQKGDRIVVIEQSQSGLWIGRLEKDGL